MLLLIFLLCVLIRPTRILEPEYVMVKMMRGTLDDLYDEFIYFRTPEEGSQVPQLTCSQMRRGSCLDLDEVNTAV